MKIQMVYLVHFHDLTGKDEEELDVDIVNVNELIDHLEDKYPGMGKLLRKEDGSAKPNNIAILNRKGERAHFVKDFSIKLNDGDHVTLI
ncbi:MAG: hypothetical protein GX363_02445 [Clostridiales bacterium]|jgi:molybdopterin converting factor small subunit|nr:hypothetical protein [Clostridiales bacterium]